MFRKKSFVAQTINISWLNKNPSLVDIFKTMSMIPQKCANSRIFSLEDE